MRRKVKVVLILGKYNILKKSPSNESILFEIYYFLIMISETVEQLVRWGDNLGWRFGIRIQKDQMEVCIGDSILIHTIS